VYVCCVVLQVFVVKMKNFALKFSVQNAVRLKFSVQEAVRVINIYLHVFCQ